MCVEILEDFGHEVVQQLPVLFCAGGVGGPGLTPPSQRNRAILEIHTQGQKRRVQCAESADRQFVIRKS